MGSSVTHRILADDLLHLLVPPRPLEEAPGRASIGHQIHIGCRKCSRLLGYLVVHAQHAVLRIGEHAVVLEVKSGAVHRQAEIVRLALALHTRCEVELRGDSLPVALEARVC